MQEHDEDTIAAQATSSLPAGVSIVRISGPKTKAVLAKIFKSKKDPSEHPRYLVNGDFVDEDGEVVDKGIAVLMVKPNSYTGEDCAELHLHGNQLIVKKILEVLAKYQVRLAQPGEFTKRAYLNGKIDLIQAEAVADLIAAQSEKSLELAKEHLSGKLSLALKNIGEPLRNVLAEIEAHIDFPEEDIEPETTQRLLKQVEEVKEKLAVLLSSYSYGMAVKDGFKVLLCGQPNVGKSSLLNSLLGYERAIVTDISGTTRDTLEEEIFLSGYKIRLCDTAGIRQTDDVVEQIGVQKTHDRVAWADCVFIVISSDTLLEEKDKTALLDFYQNLKRIEKEVFLVQNKIDLAESDKIEKDLNLKIDLKISVQKEANLDSLKNLIVKQIEKISVASEGQVLVQERHRVALSEAKQALEEAILGFKSSKPLEYISSDIRAALHQLAEIVGETQTEDILGRIFSKFCIGK